MSKLGNTATDFKMGTNKAWPIRRYCRREGSSWNRIDSGTGVYTLHVKDGQLMLVQDGTVLESLLLITDEKVNALCRDDTLLIAIRHQSTARKFKVAFESVQAAADCVSFLRLYFPIKDFTKPKENTPLTLGQMYKRLIQTKSSDILPATDFIPASFPLDDIVKICLLDPAFPDFVARVGGIISQIDQQ